MNDSNHEQLIHNLKHCPAKLVAEVIGYSPRHILRLHKAGAFAQTGKGKYNLFEVIRYFRAKENKDLTEIQQANLEATKERARSMRLESDEKELGLIPVADVEEFAVSYTKLFTDCIETTEASASKLLDSGPRRLLKNRFNEMRLSLDDIKNTFIKSLKNTL